VGRRSRPTPSCVRCASGGSRCRVARRLLCRRASVSCSDLQLDFSRARKRDLTDNALRASAYAHRSASIHSKFLPPVTSYDSGLVIVIDALDECAEDDTGHPGGELLPCLLRGLRQLSGRVKLLLTSRAEQEILQMFNDASLGLQQKVMQLHDLDGAMVRADVRTYLTRSFAEIVRRQPDPDLLDWPAQKDLDLLVDRADVLFVFAATVVRFVGTPRQDPRARLEFMLAQGEGKSASPYRLLDQLYLEVLRASVRSEDREDEESLSQMLRTVLGSIVTAQQPLSVDVLAILLEMNRANVRRRVASLSALFLITSDEPVRIFHPSFPDFIVNPRRCDDPRFLMSLDEHHLQLARGCLALLNRHLRYNMANLDSPDVANSQIEGLEDRLFRGIFHQGNSIGLTQPQALFYAARFWTTHIVLSSTLDSVMLDALSSFCDDHLFHWLELLSLIQSLAYNTQSSLLAVIRWSEVRDSSLSLMSADRLKALCGQCQGAQDWRFAS
jgi:hypothetical protein